MKIKKRYFELVVITIILLLFNVTAYAAASTTAVKVTLDGKTITFPDAQPFIENSRTMVPVRFISESMGGVAAWFPHTKTVVLTQGKKEISLKIGEKKAAVIDTYTRKEEIKTFDAAAVIVGSRTFVPLRFVSETLGCGVTWDQESKTVIIRTDGVVVNPAGETVINIAVNDKTVIFPGIKPVLKNNDIYVPARVMCEALGAEINPNSLTDDITATLDGNTIQFFNKNSAAIVNGQSYTFLEPATINNGSLIVPLRFMVVYLGGTYKWDTSSNTAKITIKDSPKEPSDNFVPYLPELTQVDEATKAVLNKYEDNKGASDSWSNLKFYRNNAETIKVDGIETVKNMAKLGKGYLETYYNFDYRDTDVNKHLKQYRYFYIPGAYEVKLPNSDKRYSLEEYTKVYVEDLVKYNVSVEGIFETDASLVYAAKDPTYRIRGRLKFRYNSADKAFFEKHESYKSLKLGQWYYVDTEVAISQAFGWGADNWQHGAFCFKACYDLNNLVEDKR